MTYEKWKEIWRQREHPGRLGQAFVNQFLKYDSLTGKIFYEEDYYKVDQMITQWLIDHCYYPHVPEVTR